VLLPFYGVNEDSNKKRKCDLFAQFSKKEENAEALLTGNNIVHFIIILHSK
jgi:hypothetical protein